MVVNVFEHFNNFPLLLAGRVLGGVSTSLLFSAFETWMVSEHRKRGFPEGWLADTFGAPTILPRKHCPAAVSAAVSCREA